MIYENGTLNKILVDDGNITMSGSTPTYHYYIQDHQGNNRVAFNQNGIIEQTNHYYPFGMTFGEGIDNSDNRYKYNGKELDRMHRLDWVDYGARMQTGMNFTTMDPLAEKYYSISPYAYCANNPIRFVDPDGKEVWLYATTLPMSDGVMKNLLTSPTHTFLVVKGSDNAINYYAYGGENAISGKLSRQEYNQDIQVYSDQEAGKTNPNLKVRIQIPIPEGMTSDNFDKKVIFTASSFGNNPNFEYGITGLGETTGNCNTSTSTILSKSGVNKETLSKIKSEIPDVKWGFGNIKAWTAAEQKTAVQNMQKAVDDFKKQHQTDFGNKQ